VDGNIDPDCHCGNDIARREDNFVEDVFCDGRDFGSLQCRLNPTGIQNGILWCNDDCTIDASGCSPAPPQE
jgi:hypothetical protein